MAAIALSACGGGGEPSGGATGTRAAPATPPPSGGAAEARYRERAGAICRDLDRRVEALGDPELPWGLAAYFERVVAVGRPALRRLEALEPPADLAVRARRAVGLARREVDLIADASRRLKASSDPAATWLSLRRPIADVVRRQDALWADLRIRDCADEELPGGASPPV
jgi:hypothetical protein